jgi:hypothetical protein
MKARQAGPTRSLHALCRMAAVIAALAITPLAFAQAAPPSSEANEANNPLTPKITVNFHDQWAPQLYDSNEYTNAFLFRGVIPNAAFGTPQLFRYTLPVATAPTQTGTTTSIGDLNLIDLFPFKVGNTEVAIGPQITAPTASKDETGTGKWQGGLAAIVIAPQKWGLLGSLVTWQQSFAGSNRRVDQNNLSFQPLILYNLPKGWYLRSTATWNFDLQRGNYAIPVGFGLGKVKLLESGTTLNIFLEPQWTVSRSGAGQPQFQVFAGLNLQFPIKR